jgi:N-acetylglutamate synthase-like GNAT family acetyltransferase
MILFQVEPLALIWDDVMRLAAQHWEETEETEIPLNPDKERYLNYDEIGYLRMYTARNEQAKLIGHAGIYLNTSMHTQIKIATEDTWFIHKDYRKGSNALRFLRFVEQDLKGLGIQEIYMTAKLTNKSGRIMEARGYTHVANEFKKVL